MRRPGVMLAMVAAALWLVACAQQAPVEPVVEEDAAAARQDTTQSDARPQAVAGFDTSTVPISDVALGAFPFFSIPAGYRAIPSATDDLEFGQAPFWAGNRFELIEGRTYATSIRADRSSGKQFSARELARNLEQVVTDAGGVRVFAGSVPSAFRDDETARVAMRSFDLAATCYADDPIQIHLLRRTDGDVWIRLCTLKDSVGLIIIQAQPGVVTSRLVPVATLQPQRGIGARIAVPPALALT